MQAICLNPSDAGIDSLISILILFIVLLITSLNPSDAGIDSLIAPMSALSRAFSAMS